MWEVLALDALFDLPDVLGCPDCTDGGAEWVEVAPDDGRTKQGTGDPSRRSSPCWTSSEPSGTVRGAGSRESDPGSCFSDS